MCELTDIFLSLCWLDDFKSENVVIIVDLLSALPVLRMSSGPLAQDQYNFGRTSKFIGFYLELQNGRHISKEEGCSQA
jgi:hypothetical protein